MASRPRWGILSVRAHLDPGALVPDLLLYDRLVFPTPADDDIDRWAVNGWAPQQLRDCLTMLGPLAHEVKWERRLRGEWGMRMDAMPEVAKEADAVAFGLTPMVIAMSAWRDVPQMTGEPIPPIPVVAFQSAAEAAAVAAFQPERIGGDEDAHRGVALLFRQCLAMPVATHSAPEGAAAFERAIELASSQEYQQARRALYDWEDQVVAQRWTVDDAIRVLKERMIAHDEIMRRKFRTTVTGITFRVVGVAVGVAAGAAAAGALGAFIGPLALEGAKALAGEAAEKLVELGSARLPQFRRTVSSAPDPGALLSMAIAAVHRPA